LLSFSDSAHYLSLIAPSFSNTFWVLFQLFFPHPAWRKYLPKMADPT
jgi:hypothetical protein